MVLGSHFKRSTQKSSFMLTENDLSVKVNIGDHTLCRNFTFAKLYWLMSLKSTNKIWFIRSTWLKLVLGNEC